MLPYLTLFAWSFLAATILPVGSEPAVVLLVHRGYSLAAIVAVATAGNYAGACTTYWIALQARRRLTADVGARGQRAARLIARYGQPALLLSWVPLLGDAIVAAAGAAQMSFLSFSIWVFVGKLLRYIVLAWGAAAWLM